LEGRYGILERDKVVLEQAQTQLLADYKAVYERATAQEEAAGRLTAEVQSLRAGNAALSQQTVQLKAQLENEVAGNSSSSGKPEVESLQQLVASLTAANQAQADQLVAAADRLATAEAELLQAARVDAAAKLEELEAEVVALRQEKEALANLQQQQHQAVVEPGATTALAAVSPQQPPQPSPLASLFDNRYRYRKIIIVIYLEKPILFFRVVDPDWIRIQ
jgi:chromosome segregation ATPase